MPSTAPALLLVAAALLVAYSGVLHKLVGEWSTNDDYSHGFLIIPIAAGLAWQRRHLLSAAPVNSSWLGLAVVLLGIAALGVGTLGSERFVSRASLLPVIGGSILYLGGWVHLRILAFPLAFLLLMIPIPAIVFNQIALPLQLIASRVGEAGLGLLAVPVLREGNVLVLANTTLEVAEACSGIRSLVSLLTLSVLYAHMAEHRGGLKVVLVAATLPIAILTNGSRVAAIGIAAYGWGPAVAEGWVHDVSGWLVFIAAFGLLLLLHRALVSVASLRPQRSPDLPAIAC